MDIVKINASDYGLEQSKAKEISNMFKPMLDTMVELEKEYNEIIKLPINPETTKLAKNLRLKYVKVRTGTAAIHKELKNFYLQGGRFVDGWKNAQAMASQGIEDSLLDIEKHYENLERERIAKIQSERANELSKFGVENIPDYLGQLEDDVWENMLIGAKTKHEQHLEMQRKIEEERIAKEKAEAEARRKMIEENERLKKEAIERERIAKIEAEKRAKEEAERARKIEAERKQREEKERKEREAYEAKIRKEREEKERIQRELEAKAEAERKQREAEDARIQAELSKGDQDKIKDLLNDLDLLKSKYKFKSKRNIQIYRYVSDTIDEAMQYISENAEFTNAEFVEDLATA